MNNIHVECQQRLHNLLRSWRDLFEKGISEYELLTLLKKPPHNLFDADSLSDSLVLFQTHFILFHTLYQLRDEWHAQKEGELDIFATLIKLQPPQVMVEQSIDKGDPLAQYYLNWDNLHQSNKNDVDVLLNSFWQKMLGGGTLAQPSDDTLLQSLAILELGHIELPSLHLVTLSTIKSQYRKLQHRYHPDKGGDNESAQAVSRAYTLLCDYVNSR